MDVDIFFSVFSVCLKYFGVKTLETLLASEHLSAEYCFKHFAFQSFHIYLRL